MTFAARAFLLVAAVALLPSTAACTSQVGGTESGAGGQAPSPEPEVAPVLEIGTGAGELDLLEPGATVPVTYGVQGGTHIWFAARCRNFGPRAALTYGITDAEGGVVSVEQSTMLPAEADQDGWRLLSGLTAFMDGPVPATQGMTVVFHGHVEDDDGHALDATGEAIVEGASYGEGY